MSNFQHESKMFYLVIDKSLIHPNKVMYTSI